MEVTKAGMRPDSAARRVLEKRPSGERLSGGNSLQAPAECRNAWPEEGFRFINQTTMSQVLRNSQDGLANAQSKDSGVISKKTSREKAEPSGDGGRVGKSQVF